MRSLEDVPPLGPGDPERIGAYRLVGRLGQGGMGRVYLGRDEAGHRVAVKVVHPELAADPTFRERFRREVAAATRVLGFFTVPVVDAGPEADTPWLATQFVEGRSLAEQVRQDGPLPPSRLCSLAAALGEALIVIHGAGIVHRDLKPSNVLLADDGPRVIDFGIARAADSDDLTRTRGFVGTYGYAPPEQVLAEGPVGPAGDVFALGGVLLYAATGRPPFGDAPLDVLAYRTVHEEPDPAGVPEPLDELVRRCLAKDPAGRPTPQEVIAAARAAQSRMPQTPAPTRIDHRTVTLRATVPALPPRAGRLPTRRALVAVASATVLAVAAGLLFVNGRGSGDGHAASGSRLAAAVRGGDPLPGIRAEGDRHRAWTALPPDPDLDNTVVGGWLTSKVLVRIDVSGVRGYEPATGEQRWAVSAPVQDLVPCNASSGRLATSGGVGVVGYGRSYTEPPVCEEVAALDTATGRLLWHRRVGPPPNALNVAAASGDVLVTSGEEGVLGLDRATGREVWKYRWVNGECRTTGVLPGPTTVAVAQSCEPTSDGEDLARVVELDAGSGRERHRYDFPGEGSLKLLSAEPLAVGYLDRNGDTHWAGFRSPGARPHDLPLKPRSGSSDPKVLADGTTLVVRLEESVNGSAGENLVAVDVPTGRLLWRRRIVDETYFFLLHISGDSVFTVEDVAAGDTALRWKVVRRRLADGVVVAEGALPASFDEGFAGAVLASGGLVVRLNEDDGPGLAAFDTGRS